MLSDPLVIVRALHFAACMVALGTLVLALMARASLSGSLLRGLAFGALSVAGLSGALWLMLVAAKILGVPLATVFEDGGLASVAFDTRFGRVACLRLVLTALAMALLLRKGSAWPALMAAALNAGIAWTGHAGAGTGLVGLLHLAADAVHVLAAGAWLGALPALALMLWRGGADAAAATRRFGSLALIAVLAVTASGVANTAILVGLPSEPLATAYGRALALKVALFAIMLGLAAVNRFRLTPALPEPRATAALACTAMAETALGIGIVLLVGFLGTQPPAAHVHSSSAAINHEAAFVHIHTAEVMAELTITPGRPGPSRATIHLWHEDYRPYAADRVRLALNPKHPGPPAVIRDAQPGDDGTWVIDDLRLASGGDWIVEITLLRNGISRVLDGAIVLAQCSNDC